MYRFGREYNTRFKPDMKIEKSCVVEEGQARGQSLSATTRYTAAVILIVLIAVLPISRTSGSTLGGTAVLFLGETTKIKQAWCPQSETSVLWQR